VRPRDSGCAPAITLSIRYRFAARNSEITTAHDAPGRRDTDRTHKGFRMRIASLAAVGFLAAASSATAGLTGTYDIGAGSNTSYLQFDFANGNSYFYTIRWDGSITGRGLFDVVAAAQPGFFSFDVVSFSFGDALFGVSIGADADSGFGTPPDFLDYWHYWTRPNDASPWDVSFIGFSDRVVADGSWDGWVFGSDGPPSVVPAPAAVATLAAALAGRGRRRRS
jgi:hypothetical protein